MIVERIMTRQVACCGPNDTLERAAQLMWDYDCGLIPVVEGDGRIVGVVTDRDACMAAYTKGQPLSSIYTRDVMSRHVRSCRSNDELAMVEQRMRLYRVRRMPVVENDRIVGVVSLNDLALAAERGHGKQGFPSAEEVVHTLAAICEHPADTASAQ
jgi:CBS domain-containing protein